MHRAAALSTGWGSAQQGAGPSLAPTWCKWGQGRSQSRTASNENSKYFSQKSLRSPSRVQVTHLHHAQGGFAAALAACEGWRSSLSFVPLLVMLPASVYPSIKWNSTTQDAVSLREIRHFWSWVESVRTWCQLCFHFILCTCKVFIQNHCHCHPVCGYCEAPLQPSQLFALQKQIRKCCLLQAQAFRAISQPPEMTQWIQASSLLCQQGVRARTGRTLTSTDSHSYLGPVLPPSTAGPPSKGERAPGQHEPRVAGTGPSARAYGGHRAGRLPAGSQRASARLPSRSLARPPGRGTPASKSLPRPRPRPRPRPAPPPPAPSARSRPRGRAAAGKSRPERGGSGGLLASGPCCGRRGWRAAGGGSCPRGERGSGRGERGAGGRAAGRVGGPGRVSSARRAAPRPRPVPGSLLMPSARQAPGPGNLAGVEGRELLPSLPLPAREGGKRRRRRVTAARRRPAALWPRREAAAWGERAGPSWRGAQVWVPGLRGPPLRADRGAEARAAPAEGAAGV